MWVTPAHSLCQTDLQNETPNWCKVFQSKCHSITKKNYEYSYSQRCHPSHHVDTSMVLHTLGIAFEIPTILPKPNTAPYPGSNFSEKASSIIYT